MADRVLKSGDYSIEGMESRIAIERKSLSDLYSTLTHGRERFERELERLRAYEYSEVVVEASGFVICNRPPPNSQALPKSIIRSIWAFQVRYPTQWAFCDTRQFAEIWTYRKLERFWIDEQTKLKELTRAKAGSQPHTDGAAKNVRNQSS